MADINISDLNLKICKYKVAKVTLNIPSYGEHDVNPLYIYTFEIGKEYEDFMYPYFRMRFTVPNEVYRKMRKDNQNITAYVRIQYALFSTSEIASDISNVKAKNFISDNFVVFAPDNSPAMTEAFDKEAEETNSGSGELQNSTDIEVLLLKKSSLALHDKIVNTIAGPGTLMDILTLLLNKAGLKNVLCSPPDNRDVYQQFILPPIRLDEEIHHICNDYAFHKSGTLLFFDFDTTYIISKDEKCTAWRNGEYKYTKLLYNPPEFGFAQGVDIDTRKRINYCTFCMANIESKSMITDQVYGSGFNIVDNSTGEVTTVSPDTKTISDSKKINRTLVVNSGNSRTSTALNARLSEESSMVQLSIDNVYLPMLNPNKQFDLLFLSSSLSAYSGKYRVRTVFTTFNKSDGEWFTPSTMATFYGKSKK